MSLSLLYFSGCLWVCLFGLGGEGGCGKVGGCLGGFRFVFVFVVFFSLSLSLWIGSGRGCGKVGGRPTGGR